jgi:hypothetical protein
VTGPLGLFWEAARELDPDVEDESRLAGARQGHLAELFRAGGVHEIEESAIVVNVEHPDFEDWWDLFLLGASYAGSYMARLDSRRRARLRELCRDRRSVRGFGPGVGCPRSRLADCLLESGSLPWLAKAARSGLIEAPEVD